MRLLQTSFDDKFEATIRKWAKENRTDNNSALFHVYVPYNIEDREKQLEKIRQVLKNITPEVPVIGCSAAGEILDGQIQDNEFVVTAFVFDEPSTSVRVLPFYELGDERDAVRLREYAKSIPDLKGIEVITDASYELLEEFGNMVDMISEDIEIFGGVAVGDDKHPAFVFGNDKEISSNGTVLAFYSGPELHFQVNRMFGWNAIGYPLKVTKSDGAVVYELDGKPAYDVYNHYLHINKGEDFFYDALEFPWEVEVDEDTKYIRHAKTVNDDGSIVMSSNIPQGSNIRLTYGDPRRIIEHTKQTGYLIEEFAPEVVNVFNCLGRKLFWAGRENVEIGEISKYLQITGFSALGEIQRHKGSTFLNNLSIVAVAMREGIAANTLDIDMDRIEKAGNMPITARLAIFINTITQELMDKNEQLNEMLYKASHDALTGIYNRGAMDRIIDESGHVDSDDSPENEDWYLIMFDIDNFKQINDQFGHSEGDHILKMVAGAVSQYTKALEGASFGRWGGEEFMIFIKDSSDEKIRAVAEGILNIIRDDPDNDKNITVSIGATRHQRGEYIAGTVNRVDELLYKAKNSGKNRVCSDL